MLRLAMVSFTVGMMVNSILEPGHWMWCEDEELGYITCIKFAFRLKNPLLQMTLHNVVYVDVKMCKNKPSINTFTTP